MTITTGALLGGRYTAVALRARGGMGEVWTAHDRVLDRQVAAKVMRMEYVGDPMFLTRWRREAQNAARLAHPSIAAVHDYGEDTTADGGRAAYMIMELVPGSSLASLLATRHRLTPSETLVIMRQAAAGLAAAHQMGIVHRDVKPGNLMVQPNGVVKLTDFGIALARDSTALTAEGQVLGTAQYVSPEQARGEKATEHSDVYALGVVGFESLAGYRPFESDNRVEVLRMHLERNPPPLPNDVPRPVRDLILKALHKTPANRYAGAAAFGEAIEQVLAGLSETRSPVTEVDPRQQSGRTHTAVLPPIPPPRVTTPDQKMDARPDEPPQSPIDLGPVVQADVGQSGSAITATRRPPQASQGGPPYTRRPPSRRPSPPETLVYIEPGYAWVIVILMITACWTGFYPPGDVYADFGPFGPIQDAMFTRTKGERDSIRARMDAENVQVAKDL
ncbi:MULTISPECIES: protein kinase domain-containing protein [unclassified Modestobacter]|uniref:protein kinase domain-containing protein n=1 Tax=unclassified Modestobacter TaxID=2643866 RepID=UPI0022AB0615|nr:MULTISPECIES: protein kinase [unclassified Modestobacter]MCZ2824603.1 protein kinase [Modestobacter sp. VKM Ac-2981]MCZ2853869.1 protein kinase [Modestobacter sp. VKM Ac-2982]